MVTTDAWIADWTPFGNVELHGAEGGEPAPDGLADIDGRLFLPVQLRFQNLTGLLFHGAAVAGGAQAKLTLGALLELADGDAGHAINDCIDCTRGLM
jgi:hypothetical protein